MSSLSTHVLDAVSGTPAADVGVTLAVVALDGSATMIGSGKTDADGRLRDIAPGPLVPGVYKITFDTASYFIATGQRGFYPEVAITFEIDSDRHYHVPLNLSPYAYSTYRGS